MKEIHIVVCVAFDDDGILIGPNIQDENFYSIKDGEVWDGTDWRRATGEEFAFAKSVVQEGW